MNGDWLKLHRKALDSQVFSDPMLWQLFCWCLLKANWKASWFMGIEIKAGSFATGRKSASGELEMLPSTWYKRIKKLESFGLISVSGNNRFTIITVKKWGLYQTTDENGNNQVTTKGQPSNNQVTTKGQPSNTIEEGKEREEGKEGKNKVVSIDGYSEEFETFWKAYPPGRKTGKPGAFAAWKKAIKKATVETIMEAVEEYADSSLGRGEYVTGPTPWLNQQRWEDERTAWNNKSANVPKSKSQTLLENISNNMDAFING